MRKSKSRKKSITKSTGEVTTTNYPTNFARFYYILARRFDFSCELNAYTSETKKPHHSPAAITQNITHNEILIEVPKSWVHQVPSKSVCHHCHHYNYKLSCVVMSRVDSFCGFKSVLKLPPTSIVPNVLRELGKFRYRKFWWRGGGRRQDKSVFLFPFYVPPPVKQHWWHLAVGFWKQEENEDGKAEN